MPLNVEFPGVGALVGYSVNAPPYTRDTPPHLTLIWQAGADEISTDYTVFAQLISDDGRRDRAERSLSRRPRDFELA